MKEEYFSLLESCKKEQEIQEYLERNTVFVPRVFIQNHALHLSLLFRKLKFGADYTTDFVYFSKSSKDWNCVLIELEKPFNKYFKRETADFHSDFHKALEQINNWKSWFDLNGNKQHFISSTKTIRTPLTSNPVNLKYVLVYGRRSEYENSDLRKSKIRSMESDDFKIMSFDSLAESIEQNSELYLCVKKNEYFEIHSSRLIDDLVFDWLEPHDYRITKELKDKKIDQLDSEIRTIKDNPSGMSKVILEMKERLRKRVLRIEEF